MNYYELKFKRKRIGRDQVLANFAKLLQDNPSVESDDDLPDNIPLCAVCADRGWIAVYIDDTNQIAVRCPKNCEADRANQARRNQSLVNSINNIIERQVPPLRITLDEYQPQNKNQARVYLATQQFVSDDTGISLDNKFKRSLVLVGQIGSGKTYLASAIHNALVSQGRAVWYMKFGEMIRRVNDCHVRSDTVTPLQVIHALQAVDCLILDDVGRDNVSDATIDLFFDIVDARYDVNLPTFITTNLNQQQMKQMFGERITDRLRHMAHWLRLDGNLRDQTGIL